MDAKSGLNADPDEAVFQDTPKFLFIKAHSDGACCLFCANKVPEMPRVFWACWMQLEM